MCCGVDVLVFFKRGQKVKKRMGDGGSVEVVVGCERRGNRAFSDDCSCTSVSEPCWLEK